MQKKIYIKSLIKYSKENRFGNVFIPFLASRKVYKVTAAPLSNILQPDCLSREKLCVAALDSKIPAGPKWF